LLVLAGIVCSSCGGDGLPLGISQQPQITSVEPCVALPGEQVTITGSYLIGLGTPNTTVTIGGVPGAFVNSATTFTIVATVPAGAGATIDVTTDIGTGSFANFTSGARSVVPEVEPNDAVDGSNATQCNGNRQASGILSTVTDKDHFMFGCSNNKKFKVKVTPIGIIPSVFINGAGMPLDSNGETAVFSSSNTNVLVGLTGGAGAYFVTLEYQQPTN
jgi:hypothetical protein